MTALAYVFLLLPVGLLAYSYAIYPALLWIGAGLRRADESMGAGLAGSPYQPTVTVVVPAYNEERQIAGAIDALLQQDYPRERSQLLIVSDASTDATDDIVRSYADRGVELLRMPVRGGKTAIENAACGVIRGEIVVNSDASIRLHRSVITNLVARLQDPTVGVASGRDVSVSARDSANSVEAGYVDYEMRLRDLETRTGGIVGASGCCYAIRTELHRLPIASDLSRDFCAPLTAKRHGFKAVSVNEALAYVPRTASLRREYVRKVRTISRGMETLYSTRQMLDPMRYGSFAWKLVSHKVCRWLVPLMGVPAAAALVVLARAHAWAAWLALFSLAVAGVAIVGALWPEGKRMPRPISIVAFAVAANVAVVHATARLLRAREDKIWEPTRRDVVAPIA
ncbi:MAG TPA: glycosyltransferase [Gemmatimonadaceae bacterium]|jgi:cellulose synthase/poly-beta-1,6-N-acetylglucosamine synthase-like glycosyltransferase|nr:glycosyltransferase [Gemmatimonadaceae bacterium]